MNNTEANVALHAKNEEFSEQARNVLDVIQLISMYEYEMDNWKTDVVTAKIAEIKTKATAAGVDLSTWDGSSAD